MTAMRTGRRQVTLRELGPGDAAVLDAVFAGMSTDSRFLRFHGAMPRLSGVVRERLAAVDGRHHLAVAAFAPSGPVGIARLITVGPRRAELAVEVVDAWHGRGVGSQLVDAVVELGRAAGITEVVAEVLAGNDAMLRLLESLFVDLVVEHDGPELTYTARLRDRALAAA